MNLTELTELGWERMVAYPPWSIPTTTLFSTALDKLPIRTPISYGYFPSSPIRTSHPVFASSTKLPNQNHNIINRSYLPAYLIPSSSQLTQSSDSLQSRPHYRCSNPTLTPAFPSPSFSNSSLGQWHLPGVE